MSDREFLAACEQITALQGFILKHNHPLIAFATGLIIQHF